MAIGANGVLGNHVHIHVVRDQEQEQDHATILNPPMVEMHVLVKISDLKFAMKEIVLVIISYLNYYYLNRCVVISR